MRTLIIIVSCLLLWGCLKKDAACVCEDQIKGAANVLDEQKKGAVNFVDEQKTVATCVGDDQPKSVFRYNCVNPNAYVASTLVDQLDDGSFTSVKLYSLDKESVLGAHPAKYILAISSFDIGEPVILLGFKTNEELSFNLLSKEKPFTFSLTASDEDKPSYLIEFTDYGTFEINGLPL